MFWKRKKKWYETDTFKRKMTFAEDIDKMISKAKDGNPIYGDGSILYLISELAQGEHGMTTKYQHVYFLEIISRMYDRIEKLEKICKTNQKT